jgi:hypothetical protein
VLGQVLVLDLLPLLAPERAVHCNHKGQSWFG